MTKTELRLRNDLESYLAARAGCVANDAVTFYWARTMRIKEFEERQLGGGNFLIGISALSVLSFLAIVYCLLTNKITEQTDESNREIKLALKNAGLSRKIRNHIIIPKKGQINQFEAFRIFVLELHDLQVCNLGIPKEKDKMYKLYDRWRNRLVHKLDIKKGRSIAFVSPVDRANGRSQKRWTTRLAQLGLRSTPAFTGSTRHWDCNVDELNSDLKKIIEWLIEFVRNDNTISITDLQRTLAWIKS